MHADHGLLLLSQEVIVMPFEDTIPDAAGGFLTLRKVSDRLGLSEAHLRREIRLRKLACHRFGRMVRISEADLAAYLLARRRGIR